MAIKMNKTDTFLIGHRRRMRKLRQRKREENLEEYKKAVNSEKRNYRLRVQQKQLLDGKKEFVPSTFEAREKNKNRQKRFRENHSTEQEKELNRTKDRENKRKKSKYNLKNLESYKNHESSIQISVSSVTAREKNKNRQTRFRESHLTEEKKEVYLEKHREYKRKQRCKRHIH